MYGHTKFDGTIGDNKIQCTFLVIDIGRFVQQRKEFFRINEGLINAAVDVSQLVEGTIELSKPT
jgi:hypothetical protein